MGSGGARRAGSGVEDHLPVSNGTPDVFETRTLTGGQTVVIDRPIPVGGSCWAVETDSGGATDVSIDHDSAATAVVVTEQNVGTGIAITATNYFGVGGMKITKVVEGPGATFADQPFVFAVACTLNSQTVYDNDVTITPPTLTASIIGLPTGASCTVAEKALAVTALGGPGVTVVVGSTLRHAGGVVTELFGPTW